MTQKTGGKTIYVILSTIVLLTSCDYRPNYKFDGRAHVKEVFEIANEKFDKGDYKGAIHEYDIVIRINPNHKEAYKKRAIAKSYLKDPDYQGAIADITYAISLNPNDAENYYLRSSLYSKIKKNTQAFRDYKEALKRNATVYANPSDILFALRKKALKELQEEEAIPLITKAREQAKIQADYGDWKGAIRSYDIIIAQNSRLEKKNLYLEALMYRNRGIAKGNLGQYLDGILDINEAIKINDKDAKAYYLRHIMYREIDYMKCAYEDFQEAQRLNKEYSSSLYIDYEESLKKKPKVTEKCKRLTKKDVKAAEAAEKKKLKEAVKKEREAAKGVM